MNTRTTKTTVTFRRPFYLRGFDEILPAGEYAVETDEELLQGISFPAYRRTATLIRLHSKPGRHGLTETLTIDPNELDAALERDLVPIDLPSAPVPSGAPIHQDLDAAPDTSAPDRADDDGLRLPGPGEQPSWLRAPTW